MIFISYRREDSAAHVGRLFEDLRRKFGRSAVFMDIDTIEPGQPFADRIATSVKSATVVLVAIGRRWLDVTDSSGRRRIDNQDDFVRLEIETALASNLRVIPVLFGGAAPPQADALPASLRPLAALQATEISDARFPYDTSRLSQSIYRGLSKQDRLRTFATRRPIFVSASLLACVFVGGVALTRTEWMQSATNRAIYGQSADLGERKESMHRPPRTPDMATGSSSEPFGGSSSSSMIDVETMKLKREIDLLGQILDLMGTGRVLGTIGVHLAQVSDAPVYISSVDPKGAGVKAGLNAGDILMTIDGMPIKDRSKVTFDILSFPTGTTHMIAVSRGARELAFPVMVEVMGESDINEFKAAIEDRAKVVNRLYSNRTRSNNDRPDPQLKH